LGFLAGLLTCILRFLRAQNPAAVCKREEENQKPSNAD
jgi:hypothetical protein